MYCRNKSAFNLVELLITLSIVALLTTVIFNAVNDYRDKLRSVIVKSDLTTLASMCKYVESMERTTGKTLVVSVSTGATELSTALSNYIIKIPAEDPWGNQYYIDTSGATSTVKSTNSGGTAYIVDGGLGRIISPGPDGICHTQIGFGKSDTDRDIVIEYRQSQWLAFNLQQKIYLAKGDGSFEPIFIYNGDKLRVSPDCQKFVCLESGTNILSWGMLDENPGIQQKMHLATGGTGIYVVGGTNPGDDAFPFWAPDSVHIIYTRKGGVGYNLYSLNTATKTEMQMTKDQPIKNEEEYFQRDMQAAPRSIFNDGRCASYQYVSQDPDGAGKHDAFITISIDGKVAYYNQHKASMDIVLLNGTGHRTILVDTTTADLNVRERYRPLFWLDTETIIFTDKSHNYLYRVRQDGTYKIQLYSARQNGSDLTNNKPFSAFTLSPDRRFISFCVSTNTRYRVVRTDGAGCVSGPSVIDNNFPAVLGGKNHSLWSTGRKLLSDGKTENKIYISTDGSAVTSSTIQCCTILDGGKHIEWRAISQNDDNPDSGIVPYSWDLDDSGNLLAVASMSSGNAVLRDGIFVYSINGPAGAITDITKSLPDNDRIPTDGTTYFAVFWIK